MPIPLCPYHVLLPHLHINLLDPGRHVIIRYSSKEIMIGRMGQTQSAPAMQAPSSLVSYTDNISKTRILILRR